MLTAESLALLDSAQKKQESDALVYAAEHGRPEAEKLLKLEAQKGEIERELAQLKDFLVRALRPFHVAECLRRKEYNACVLVPTAQGTAQVLFQHRWTKIPAAKEAELRALLGADYDRCFRPAVSLAVKKEIAEDPAKLDAVISELAALAGPRFAEWFEADRALAPTRNFTEAVALTIDQATKDKLGLKQIVPVSRRATPLPVPPAAAALPIPAPKPARRRRAAA